MAALFEFSEVVKATSQDQVKNTADKFITADLNSVDYALGLNKKLLASFIPCLEKNKQWHFPSFGQWSAQHTIEHILSLTGPARITLTSWAISEKAVRALVKLQKDGTITQLTALFDERVRKYAPNGWQLANHSINVALGKCHAKNYIIVNNDWAISIVSSANLSENRRTECYVITEHRGIAEFHEKWIAELVEKRKELTQWK